MKKQTFENSFSYCDLRSKISFADVKQRYFRLKTFYVLLKFDSGGTSINLGEKNKKLPPKWNKKYNTKLSNVLFIQMDGNSGNEFQFRWETF